MPNPRYGVIATAGEITDEAIEAKRGIELGQAGVEGAADAPLDAAQAVGDRVAVDAQRGRRRRDVGTGVEVRTEGLPRGDAAVALAPQGLEESLSQRGGEQIVSQGRGQQRDFRVAHAALTASAGDAKRREGLTMCQAPAVQPGGRLADGHARGGRRPSPKGGAFAPGRVDRLAASKPGPGDLVTVWNQKQAAVESPAKLAAERLRSGIGDEETEMNDAEVIFELGGIERLAGEQATNGLELPLRRSGTHARPYGFVLSADGGDEAIESGGLRAQDPTQTVRGELLDRRLLDNEVADNGLTRTVATKHRVEGYPMAGGKMRLVDQNRRWSGNITAVSFENLQRISNGGGNGAAKARHIVRVDVERRPGNGKGPREHGLLDLGTATAQALDQLGGYRPHHGKSEGISAAEALTNLPPSQRPTHL